MTSVRDLRPTDLRGILWILGETVASGIAIGLSAWSFGHIGKGWGWIPLWFASQLGLGLLMYHWFVLMHGCGHRALCRSRLLNDVFGHVASFFCLVPYTSWRYIHAQHHIWVGWMDRDPTTRAIAGPPPSLRMQRLMDFCWKFWIPVFSLAFGVSVFWNFRYVATVAPLARQRRKTWFSIVFVAAALAGSLAFGGAGFLSVWALAYFCFLVISDPVLLSQHVHIPLQRSEGADVAPFAPRDQDRFTRTIVAPAWVSRWIFLQFTTHGVHHAFPQVAHYDIHRVEFRPSHPIWWTRWIRAAKAVPATQLLYESSRESGKNF